MSIEAAPSPMRRRYDRAWWATFVTAVVINTLIGDYSRWITVPVGIAFLVGLVWLFLLSLREHDRERKANKASGGGAPAPG
ncbi:hypothetical protein ACFOWE_29055 [Planomonospora corallina]|uniref:Uncharacterized protein n=1 Tax=Planomonospora corallina TaxID=1806052 RepID=A0ABV8IIU3_9ACTN